MSIGFRDPHSASDNVVTPSNGQKPGRVVVTMADPNITPVEQRLDRAVVSPEIRPGFIVVKVHNSEGRLVNTVFFATERILMVQQFEGSDGE